MYIEASNPHCFETGVRLFIFHHQKIKKHENDKIIHCISDFIKFGIAQL